MDNLIVSLQKFAIHKDEKKFENHLDIIMDNLDLNKNEESEIESDNEWELLKSDYSKLNYICQLLNHYHYVLPKKFFELLGHFTNSLDKTTRIYLSLIDEDIYNEEDSDEELKRCYVKIKKIFNESLEMKNNNVAKVELLLKGYKILVPIIEDFRREKWEYAVDPEFKEKYHPNKKQKTK